MNFIKKLFGKDKASEHEMSYTKAMMELVILKNYPSAIKQFQDALRLKPDYADAHIFLGSTYIKTREYDLAAAALERGLALDPKNKFANLSLAEAYLAMHTYENFFRQCERTLTLSEQSADLVNGFAADVAKAETSQEKAVIASMCMGLIYYTQAKWEDLQALCEGLLELDSSNQLGHYLLGVAYFHKDRFDDAQAELRRAAELGSKEALKHPVLGNCDLCGVALQAGTKRYTVDEFRKAIMAGLRPPIAVMELGVALSGSPSFAENVWVQKAMADDKDWLVCSACCAAGANFLPAK